jgi:hypothetical protein
MVDIRGVVAGGMDRWSAMIQNARAANVNAGIADEIALVATLAVRPQGHGGGP